MARPRVTPSEPAEPHYLGHRERLRAKLLAAGPEALADYELLEFLLFSARPRGDMKPLAKALLTRFGSLAGVLGADKEALRTVRGMGDASVAALLATRAAAVQFLRGQLAQRPVLQLVAGADRLLQRGARVRRGRGAAPPIPRPQERPYRR